MRALVIIPARLDSSRLPGKPLRLLAGRTLIEWTWRAASESGFEVMIATDSEAIINEAQRIGARSVLTGPAQNGTERCAQALRQTGLAPEVVINWQGDSPLTPSWVTHRLERALTGKAEVATPVRRADKVGKGEVTVVSNFAGHALYFSRCAIPPPGPFLAHIGLYAYRAEALQRYGERASPLEVAEGLEQNRWLELGVNVSVVPVETGHIREVNEPADVRPVEVELEALG